MPHLSPILTELQCSILPGAYPHPGRVPPLYNAVYSYWKKTWTEFFEKAGSGPNALNVDNFMRSRYVIVLHRGLDVAATLSCSVFNNAAEVTFDHPSVKPFPQIILERFRRVKDGSCITGEYLSVHPEFRKGLVGISLADLLVGLLMEIFREEQFSYVLATPVRTAKVSEIAKAYGCVEVGSYMKIGVDCQMVYTTPSMVRYHPDPLVREAVSSLWASKTDHTLRPITESATAKAA